MEKPCILATTFGAPGGIYKRFAPVVEKHFTIIPYETFPPDQKNLSEQVKVVFVWGGALKVDRGLMQSLPNLKVVVNGGVGVDHLDIPMINSFGVKVCNTPHVVDNATADIGIGLMLASMGMDVSGATLGIIGMGRIGYKVARRAQGFDMKILYHNRNRRPRCRPRCVGGSPPEESDPSCCTGCDLS
ncbi:unnamed protein product [Coregonus sp. 'balchen']|nr:unnamed protein product [Coregonus sp. 'balchen']